MKYKQTKRAILALVLLFLACPQFLSAQTKKHGFEGEGGLLYSKGLETEISFYLGGKYNYWLNDYVALSGGGMVIHSYLDTYFSTSKATYDVEDHIINLAGSVGVKLSTPTVKGFGVEADAAFLFDPIPFNAVVMEKRYYSLHGDYRERDKTKMVFTQFNPSYHLQVGLFYEKKQQTGVLRFTLGAGLTNYNPYQPYYRAKIDGVRLKDELTLRPDRQSLSIFFRVSGFAL
ncbi:porin family protein [Dysgonomonas sp. 25]|uniref:porin family protein n=1 Tax=Dysgonomonas sp. 25 TaxID=2302933 RepID=UPI0013CFAEF9|nr:porin family protein [Dysgonomonas sp. 25]NDV70195.1 hypothetical protein [Dysgonomonas sp. 25]